SNTNQNSWGLEKDARLRLWPAGSPLLLAGSFGYPVKQRIFADDTQMANEPTYVDWGENPLVEKIYYHDGLDFGGTEKETEILSATDGLIVVANKEVVDDYEDNPILERYRKRDGGRREDVVYVVDDRGWLYRYSHLSSVDPAIKIGINITKGQKVGMLGKEGASGGWVHLHFAIKYELPSGKWATEEAFAYVWNAYVEEHNPPVIALARPHHLIWEGQSVTLDGTKSKSFSGGIVKYEWIFHDGSRAFGPVQEYSYDLPGTYSEVLKVVDSAGNIDYDYCVVQVRNKKNPEKMPPSIHAVYHPTLNIKPGDPITFGVRTFQTEYGEEVWDFGDGSPKVIVKSAIPKVPEGEKRPYTTKGYD
ncbi:peptidoglycan DD-metalloendopeptidase family protein, partial [bacterium]|nr:peptidoglycan DD-metalloendopeptidase family protein [bacterium]